MKSEQAQTTDAQLLEAITRGDESSLAALYDRYNSILFGLLLRILHDRAEAEDVLQEVFWRVWQHAADFDETRGRVFTWLVTIARSRAIDRLRSLGSRERTVEEAARTSELLISPVTNAATATLAAEQREIVSRALAQIPEEQRRTLVLAYFEGLTQSEIAARTNEPLGTVKTRTRAGLARLRILLRSQAENLR
ncbi:MAG: sigma-70 family RNA polymerase sigma factor [Pyrinomonadaceae bacterium]